MALTYKEGTSQESEFEGYIERSNELYQLSLTINEMIIAFEKEHDVNIMANGFAGEQYPLAYPNEPKVVLISVLNHPN